jgi:Flp pilus assembly protein TadB
MKSYIAQIEKLLQERPDGTDWDAVKQDLLVQIGFFQHERLVHLLVTLSSALLMAIFLAIMLLTKIWLLAVVFLIVFVLLIFYFVHYYRLENGVQKLYNLYDEINKAAVIGDGPD